MSEFLSSKIVTTRKEHSCFGCGRKIEAGTKMQAIVSVDSGKASTDYWCDVCQEYWNRNMQYGDEISFGELRSDDPEGWGELQKQIELEPVGAGSL